MIRKYMVLWISVVLFIQVCPVFAEKVLIDTEILEKILKRQEQLEQKQEIHIKKIKDLEKALKNLKKAAPPDQEEMKYLKEDNEEILDRLDVVEKKSILDKVHFSGDFRTRLDFFRFDNVSLEPGKKSDEKLYEVWSNRLRLNLRSDISKNLIFHSRMRYTKLWGNRNSIIDSIMDTMNICDIPDTEGKLHIERAYMDFFVPKTPLSFTFGRLPTLDGPPYEFRNNTTRKATWPVPFVNCQNDGIIANLSMDEWTGLKDSMLRLGYTLVNQHFNTSDGKNNRDRMRVAYLGWETDFPSIRNSLLWLGYYRIFDVDAVAPEGGSYPESSGDIDNATIYLQFNDIKKTGLDFFFGATYAYTHARSEGTMLVPDYEIGLMGDSLHDSLGKNREGHIFYTGLRYKLPFESLNYPKIGFEYNYASKYAGVMAFEGDEELVNKIGLNGNGYELYYIQPIIKNNMFLRIGGMYLDFKYHNPYFIHGEMEESDMRLKSFYFLTDIRF